MSRKGIKKTSKKYYWEMLVREINNQYDLLQATFHYLPKKSTQLNLKKSISQISCREPQLIQNKENNQTIYSYAYKTQPYKRYQLSEPFNHIYLTQREIDSLKAILEEKTLIGAALRLRLSPRTLEFYFDNIKKKLNCRKKKEVLDIIKNYRLLED